ncbi:MAG: PD40 domain-containing protein [Anaerolineales bacterium]|nr:MAG: PD40 domain-containing protein [Anaerolineales bacterium]
MPNQPLSPDSFQTFGDLLRYLRRRERLTQLELSIAVGYSEAQIGRLENNQRRPDLTTLKALFISALHIEDEPELIARFLELAQSARQEDAPAPGISPYRGLLFFDESDAELFFGRETLTAHIADRVTDLVVDSNSRFLTVVGASGSGKSSLMRAGLAVALKQAGWEVYIFTPGEYPLRALAMLLEQKQTQVESDPLLILVDQFEEIFTLCRDETERGAFIEKLLELASESSKRISVVIALRADFYSHCAQYPALRQAVAAEQEYIGQMTLGELRRAIEEPARQKGWEFEHGLVDMLLYDIGAQGTSQPEPGALPLLSHALLATWERRRGRMMTLEGYRASGGVRGAIAETAESLFTDQLNRTQQEMARDVFLRLTELGEGTEDTRRRAALNELVRRPEEAAHLRAVLNMLADARLITLNEDSAEVAHEALIREWQRLHEWLTQDREGLLLHRHLTESARGWEMRGHDPSELYRGARLAQAREWAMVNEGRLNPSERLFLAASIEQEERDALEREAQRQRELEAAYKLAETQTQAAKQLRRRAVFLTGAFILSILLIGVSIYYGNQAKNNGLKAQSRELAAAAIINLDDDPERSLLLALQAISAADTLEAENALHRSVLASRVRKVLQDDSEIWSVAYSPDGKRITTACWDNTAQVWDADSGQRLFMLTGHTESVNGITYSPDGKLIATASDDGTAKIWDAETGRELFTLSGHDGALHDIVFSPDGRYLGSASDDGTAKIWNVKTGEQVLTFSGHGDTVFDIAFSPHGNLVATSGLDEYVRIWDPISGDETLALPFEAGDQLRGLAFSPDGTRIAVTSTRFPWGRVWDASTGEILLNGFPGHRDALVDIAFSSNGDLIATASSDATAKIWDSDTGELLYTLSGHTLPVTGVAFDPAGTHLATTSWDQTTRLWSIQPTSESLFIPIEAPWSMRISYSPDGKRILADDPEEKSTKVWDASSGKEFLNLKGQNTQISHASYSPDGKSIAVANDKNLIIYDSGTGKQITPLSGHTSSITSLDFSSDGTRLISGSSNGELLVWDVINGRQVLTLQGLTEGFTPIVHYEIFAVAYSPDGKYILSADTYGQAIIWDASSGEKQNTVIFEEAVGNHSFPDIGFDAAFSPDGRFVVITGGIGTVRIWDVSTGEDVLTLKGHTGAVNSVTFSADGQLIATASVDGTAKVWEAATGTNLLALPVDRRGAGDVAFSPDGKRLAVGAVSGIYVFVLPIEQVAEIAKSQLTRSLTDEECQQYLHVPFCPATP